jgi:ABC-type transport system substrate-binding protein
MYQVYHKNSSATSTKAWGYDFLLTSGSTEENKILDDLADLIDAGRETNDQDARAEIYRQAMMLVLDLAVELPCYQRDVLYAFNGNVLNTDTMPTQDELNPFSSPLDRIWEIELKAN